MDMFLGLNNLFLMIGVAMTPQERRQHTIINGSRRKRIARGSGTQVQDVNRLLKNYTQVVKMIKKLTSIVAIILLTGASLVGCGAGDSGMGSPSSSANIISLK